MDNQIIKYFLMQTKLFDKKMRWNNFLLQFHFHIAHIPWKQNVIVDALSRRPMVNAISISFYHDLTSMIGNYAEDGDFASILENLENGNFHYSYSFKDGFLLHGSRLCITKNLREKVMYESHAPPYAGHREIQATTQEIYTYFYWPTVRQAIHT